MMTLEELMGGNVATPGGLGFQDGWEEIVGTEDVEDLFSDIGKGIGGLVGNLPIVGGIVKALPDPLGIFQGGQGGQGGGLLGGLPGLGGLLGGAGAGPIAQGVGQALGVAPAVTPAGSVVGAGLGGVQPGTGPLPGALGQVAQQLFGQLGLPPANVAAATAQDPALYGQLAAHTERAGRAIVRRILGATAPQLRAIQELMDARRNQLQATAEHRQLAAADAFQGEVMHNLRALAGNRTTANFYGGSRY